MPSNSAQKHEQACHHLSSSTAKENKLLSKSSIRRNGHCFCKSISSRAFIVVAHLDAWLRTWMNAFMTKRQLSDDLLSGPPNVNSLPLSGGVPCHRSHAWLRATERDGRILLFVKQRCRPRREGLLSIRFVLTCLES